MKVTVNLSKDIAINQYTTIKTQASVEDILNILGVEDDYDFNIDFYNKFFVKNINKMDFEIVLALIVKVLKFNSDNLFLFRHSGQIFVEFIKIVNTNFEHFIQTLLDENLADRFLYKYKTYILSFCTKNYSSDVYQFLTDFEKYILAHASYENSVLSRIAKIKKSIADFDDNY